MTSLAITSRKAAFATIRIVTLLVGAIATTVDVGYLIIAIAGPDVWWSAGGGNATGAFVPFPLPLRIVNGSAITLWCLTVAALAFIVMSLARAVATEVRFATATSRAVWSLAIVLALGSTLAQIAENVARGSALIINEGTDPLSPVGAPIHWASGLHLFLPNPPLLGLRIVLAILAYIVSAGWRVALVGSGSPASWYVLNSMVHIGSSVAVDDREPDPGYTLRRG